MSSMCNSKVCSVMTATQQMYTVFDEMYRRRGVGDRRILARLLNGELVSEY